jgi:chorismate-pyruvate lyase
MYAPSGQPSAVDVRRLAPFQRVLLATDGTVTDILEAYTGQKILVVKLLHSLVRLSGDLAGYLEVDARDRVLLRRILLQGQRDRKNYIYAESLLLPDRLNRQLRQDLFATRKPLGQLIGEAQLETRREILGCGIEPAAELGRFFGAASRSQMIARTYRVFVACRPVMLITEKFPRALFRRS